MQLNFAPMQLRRLAGFPHAKCSSAASRVFRNLHLVLCNEVRHFDQLHIMLLNSRPDSPQVRSFGHITFVIYLIALSQTRHIVVYI